MQASPPKNPPAFDPLAITVSLMDAGWLYVTAWLFSAIVLSQITIFSVPQPLVLALVEFAGVLLGSYLLRRRGFGERALRITIGAVGLGLALLIAFAFRPWTGQAVGVAYLVPLIFIFLIALGLWIFGGYRATDPDSFDRAYSQFRMGLVAISVSTLIGAAFSGGQLGVLWNALWGAVLLFFGAGLASLALGNRETVRRETGDASLTSWGPLVAASVGVVLVLGVLGQALGGGDLISVLQNVVVDVLAVIGAFLYLVLLILLFPFSLCGIRFSVSDNAPPAAAPTPGPTPANPFEGFQRQAQAYNPLNVPPEWQAFFMILAGLLLASAVLYVMLRWLRIYRSNRVQQVEEEHERFGSWSLFVSQVRHWLDRLLGRFRKPQPVLLPVEEDDLASLQGRADMAGILTVRQIYARLLRQARSAGYPRLSNQTPSEYLGILSRALPTIGPDLETITSAYLEARYSPNSPSPPSVNLANEAWRHIESSGIVLPVPK